MLCNPAQHESAAGGISWTALGFIFFKTLFIHGKISELRIWRKVLFVTCNENGPAKFWATLCHKILLKLDEFATVTYEQLRRAYWEHSVSRTQVLRWRKTFWEGPKKVWDKHRAGRPSTPKRTTMRKGGEHCYMRLSINVDNDQWWVKFE